MSKLIHTDEGRVIQRRWVAPVVVLVIILVMGLIGTGIWWWLQRDTAPGTKRVSNVQLDQKALESDTRSDPVKIASQTATMQAANGDTAAALSTLNGVFSKTSSADEKVSLYFQIASINAAANNKDAAIAAEQAAIKLQPDNWQVYKNQGSIYAQLNDEESAKASYAKALELLQGTADYTANHVELEGLASGAIQ